MTDIKYYQKHSKEVTEIRSIDPKFVVPCEDAVVKKMLELIRQWQPFDVEFVGDSGESYTVNVRNT